MASTKTDDRARLDALVGLLDDIAATAEYGLMGRSSVRARKVLAICAKKARTAIEKANKVIE